MNMLIGHPGGDIWKDWHHGYHKEPEVHTPPRAEELPGLSPDRTQLRGLSRGIFTAQRAMCLCRVLEDWL